MKIEKVNIVIGLEIKEKMVCTMRVIIMSMYAIIGVEIFSDFGADGTFTTVLTTRDTAEWYRSVRETLWAIRVAQRGRRSLSLLAAGSWVRVDRGREGGVP